MHKSTIGLIAGFAAGALLTIYSPLLFWLAGEVKQWSAQAAADLTTMGFVVTGAAIIFNSATVYSHHKRIQSVREWIGDYD